MTGKGRNAGFSLVGESMESKNAYLSNLMDTPPPLAKPNYREMSHKIARKLDFGAGKTSHPNRNKLFPRI